MWAEWDKTRFWRFVEKTNDCWLWKSRRFATGFGMFAHEGNYLTAHTVSWWLGGNPWPKSVERLLSTCGNKLCVNPAHMELRKPAPPKPEAADAEVRRFWKNVHKSDGCWTYGCEPTEIGRAYGHFGRRGQKSIVAHRYSWALHNGPIPDGMVICHRCDNKPCVRPDHLFLGTQADNMNDRALKGACERRSGRREIPRLQITRRDALELYARMIERHRASHPGCDCTWPSDLLRRVTDTEFHRGIFTIGEMEEGTSRRSKFKPSASEQSSLFTENGAHTVFSSVKP